MKHQNILTALTAGSSGDASPDWCLATLDEADGPSLQRVREILAEGLAPSDAEIQARRLDECSVTRLSDLKW